MNKKALIISLIALILLAAGVGFWKWEKDKRIKETKKQENVKEEDAEKEKQEKISDEQLVWYEVPELGIKFKVTLDTREDLGYGFKEYENYNKSLTTGTAMFYSKAETDKKLTGCELSEEAGWSCGWFQLNYERKKDDLKTRLNYKNCEKAGGNDYVLDSYNNLCSFRDPSRGAGIISDKTYKDFFHTPQSMQNKNFGIYLDTITEIRR